MKSQQDNNINVFVRVRPFNDKEANTSTFIDQITEKSISVKDKERDLEHDFTFDHVFGMKATQDQVYQKIGKSVVESAFEGFNGTIFAYGQTSSGKTHTCIGPDYEDAEKRGVLPRLISNIFSKIAEAPSYIEFRIKVTMVEIYMQKIKDLLDASKTDLKIRESKAKGIYIQDVTEEYISSTSEAFKFIKKGIQNRSTGMTNMNDVSSRSHMAFIITVYQNNLKDASAKSGKIILVDLAGSEKISKTLAEGKLLDEAKQINKSLSQLGNVINSLTDGKIGHVPYRNSKLTRLLQESLGGNSKTNLIINISPSSFNATESISSLRFGFRAKQIKNKPKINKEYTVAELLLLLQKAQKKNLELEDIIKELTASKKKNNKKQSITYAENLLDSDNPILSGLSQNQHEESLFVKKKSSILKNNQKFKTEYLSDEQEDKANKEEAMKYNEHKQESIDKNTEQNYEKQRQIDELISEIESIHEEKINFSRELEIMKERYQCMVKESRLATHKINAEKKENQTLLQKYIKETLEKQEKDQEIKALQHKIAHFQESFIQLSTINKKATQKSNVFGIGQEFSESVNSILSEILNAKDADEEEKKINQKQKQLKDQFENTTYIKQLESRVKKSEEELILFKHLQNEKEALIKEKMSFVKEKERIYKDLENRIEKVLDLQERLDEEKQKRHYYEELIESEEEDKSRKILSLQKHINEISQNYYVLKGQQSSWLKNNKHFEHKLSEKVKKIMDLEGQNMELKAEVDSLNEKCEELQILHQDNKSILDLDGHLQSDDQEENNTNKQAKIVKVLRSSIFQ